jgi:hypothetical protein
MTRIPKGSDLVLNKVSGAPGFWIHNVIVMAGVPSIMQAMLDEVAPKLKTSVRMLSETVRAMRARATLVCSSVRSPRPIPRPRSAAIRSSRCCVKARLETIFAKGFEPLALPIDQRPQRSRCRNRTLYRHSRPGRPETAWSGTVTRPMSTPFCSRRPR